MKVSMLMENKAASPVFCCAHGVSMFIEAGGQKVLFDAGPDDAFTKNAEALGIDLNTVDFAVLSHAHSDHGGGLPTFLARTGSAPVYLNKRAFGDYNAYEPGPGGTEVLVDAGIDPALAQNPRVVLADDLYSINEHYTLFTMAGNEDRKYPTAANAVLVERLPDGTIVPDRFLHEQNLLVRADGVAVLFSGCAHSGIVDILARAEQLNGGELDAVLGGFHLHNPDTGAPEDTALLDAIGGDLAARKKTRYYAFHCTGDAPFAALAPHLPGRLHWLSAGETVTL